MTGSIIALRGISDKNGYFEVYDHCYAGIPFTYANLPLPLSSSNKDLYAEETLNNHNKQFVAFVSGLEFG